MAKAINSVMEAVLRGERLWLLVRNDHNRFCYAIDLTACGRVANGRADFDIPTLVPDTDLNMSELWVAVKEARGFVPVHRLENVGPTYVTRGSNLNIRDFYIDLNSNS